MEIECILSGFGIRGYSHYKDKWNLKEHDKKMHLACKTNRSEVGETLGIFLGTTLVGNMPSELTCNMNQDSNIRLKNFLKNFPSQTEIIAMVTENIPMKGGHGLEVPCEFYLRGKDTEEIRGFLENVRTEVNKLGKQTAGISCSKIKKISKHSKKKMATEDTKSKKKRPLSAFNLFVKDKSAEITSQNPGLSFKERSAKQIQMWKNIDPELKQEYERRAEKLKKSTKKDMKRPDKKQSNTSKTDPKKGASREQTKGGPKRRSDESEETIPKKVLRTEKNGAAMDRIQEHEDGDDKIVLEDKDLDKICQHIGKNWRLFGKELGISDTRMDHFQSDSRSTIMAILDMLKAWKQEHFDMATLYRFKQAMKRCPSVRFNKTEINKIFKDVRKQYQSQGTGACSTEQL